MVKKVMKFSATAMMRQAIPLILKVKFEDGATFDELWKELLRDEKLAKVMINDEGENRLGLLQGLTNRIKDNKEENITIIKKVDGKNYYLYYDNSIDKLTKLTENYLSTIQNIRIDKSTDLNKDKEALLKEHKMLQKKLSEINQKMKKEA